MSFSQAQFDAMSLNDREMNKFTLDSNGNIAVRASILVSTSFLALTDSPDSYVGQALRKLRVNGAENAIEFVDDGVFSDTQFKLQDNVDATKQFQWQLSAITAGQTRVLTMADRNVDMANFFDKTVDTNLNAINLLAPSNDDIIQRKAGAWTNRTPAQFKTDLVLVKGDVGLGNVDNTSDATKNAAAVALTNKTFNASLNSLSNITLAMMAANVADTDVTLTANSDLRLATQKAIKSYVDSVAAGLKWKQSVRAATTANGADTTAFENGDTIDGVVLATGDRILRKDQTAQTENGIFIVQASGAPVRATDADTGAELKQASVFVEEGTVNADTAWVCTNNGTITIGSTNIAFALFSSVAEIADGNKGDVTVSGGGITWSINNGAITLAKMANMATASLIGRNTAGTGVPEVLSASTVRTLLGLVIGTNVQAWDADLDALAGLASAADKLPYFTGAAAAAVTTLTSFIRTLLDDVDAATARTTLGLAIGTNVQAWDADLDAFALKTAPSGVVVGTTDTQTLSNKRITPRIGTEASSSASTPTADTVDQWNITALAAADTIAAPSGTPVDGQSLVIRIKDNATARVLAWNAIYRASSDLALPLTTTISKTMYLGFKYNAADSKWDFLAFLNNI